MSFHVIDLSASNTSIHKSHNDRNADSENNSPPKEVVRLRCLEQHRLLLCVTCGYCVLSKALDAHLKHIHRLPLNQRQLYTDQAKKLDLVSSEHDIRYPDPDAAPIEGLPSYEGYVCAAPGCRHMCIHPKRMQTHWREQHFQLGRTIRSESLRCHGVRLQTFMIGKNTHYFQVNNETVNHQSTFESIVIEPKTLLRRSPSHEPNETSVDWMLTKQFSDHSHATLIPVKSAQSTWRDRVVQTCTAADYVKYIFLSMTASHIAFTNPDSRAIYGQAADRYRGLAIQKFSAQAINVESSNFFEIYNFARMMTMCYLANTQLAQMTGQEDYSQPRSALPDWVVVQRRGHSLTWAYRGQGRIVNALQGPAQPLYAARDVSDIDTSTNPYDGKLMSLEADLKALTIVHVDIACLEALHMLRQVWATPYQLSSVGFRDMTLRWTAKVSDRYIELLQNSDTVAIIIFAHYCVLWTFAEDQYWYMKGHAESMLFNAVRCVTLEWQAWLLWPISMVFGKRFAACLQANNEPHQLLHDCH